MKEKYTDNSETLNNLPPENNPSRDFLSFIWDLLKTFVIVFVIAYAIRYFLVQPFVVEGASMLPNFEDKEYLLAEKISYSFSEQKRGDVVIFSPPTNPQVNYIKRIIGLPGETIKIANNQVTIINNENPSGVVLNENYLQKGVKTYPPDNKDLFQIKIPDDSYFVMGDNREHSSDSREWGALPSVNIIGRTWLIIKPLDRFGIQKRVEYNN